MSSQAKEDLQPTPGASGVTIIATKFWRGDKLRYCILEYWSCGAHSDEECCSACRKRVVAFRYRKRDAEALIDKMLEAAAV